jgi:Fe-coproporphyrin III synthase
MACARARSAPVRCRRRGARAGDSSRGKAGVPLIPTLARMPVLVLSPHSRCNCRCLMCDIWKGTDAREISAEDLERHIASIEKLGVEWAVFTGGEPLMHSDLFRLCEILRQRGIRITVLSSGLLLERHASALVSFVDDVIVSLDGPPEVHDRIRGVPSAYRMLEAGVQALHRLKPDFPVSARCTVQRANCSRLRDTVAAARGLGLSGISFLAADTTSSAFNRPSGWPAERLAGVALSSEETALLEAEIESLIGECATAGDGFVAEGPEKLRKIVRRSHTPVCNAPWVSVVVEADGVVRPCFFHPPIGQVNAENTLLDVINGTKAIEFRAALDVASNPICRRCVCSLNWKQ